MGTVLDIDLSSPRTPSLVIWDQNTPPFRFWHHLILQGQNSKAAPNNVAYVGTLIAYETVAEDVRATKHSGDKQWRWMLEI